MKRSFSNKFWIALVGGVLVLSAIAALALGRTPAKYAHVYQNGVLVRTLVLSAYDKPYTFTIECDAGSNAVSVEHGRICVADASCPDGLCVRQGWASRGATPIVCLPHGLVITLDGGKADSTNTGVDAIVG